MDANATTRAAPEVRDVVVAAMTDPRNAGSAHWAGDEARGWIDTARGQVAKLLRAAPTEITFTSGATEANSLAIEGVAAAAVSGDNSGRRRIVSATWEHHAVLEPLQRLQERGWEVVLVDVDCSGMPQLDQLAAAINNDTLLVTLMAANNETGVVAPIAAISDMCHESGALLHSDATQVAPWDQLDVDDLGVDLLSLSGHKMHGPQGVGALYVSRRLRQQQLIVPLVPGGGQERGLRGGTVNVAGVAGLGAAAELVVAHAEGERQRVAALRDNLEQRLLAVVPDAQVNGGSHPRTPGTSNICFGGLPAEALLSGAPDLAASTGSACRAGAPEPSHVLLGMGLSWAEAESSIRFSLSTDSTQDDVDQAVQIMHLSARQVEEAMA
ncbi:cysteine desulfurase family protein [Nocardioides zeae]|nr:cysteine desulfurase family protein [Nocardioides zeae]